MVAVTMRVTVVVCWTPPPVPVTVMGISSTAILKPTVRVMVELPPPGAAIVLELKLAVVPTGGREAESAIELSNPPLPGMSFSIPRGRM